MKEPSFECCPFFWKTPMTEAGDEDCGCDLNLDWKPKYKFLYIVCYLPMPLKALVYKLIHIHKEYLWWKYARKYEKRLEE